MIRMIAIALSMATIGCVAQRGLIEIDETQNRIPQDAVQKLKRGMRAKIQIRKGASVPFTDRTFECIIDKIGPGTLTVITPRKSALQKFEEGMQTRITVRREIDVPFNDRTFECIIDKMDPNAITVTKTRYAHSGKKFTFHPLDISSIGHADMGQKLTFHHADILSIEYVATGSNESRFFSRIAPLLAIPVIIYLYFIMLGNNLPVG